MTTSESPPSEASRSVEIPEEVARAITERLPGTEFDTIDEYVGVALEHLLREVERTDDEEPAGPAGGDDEGPSDELAERLESLGYL